MALSGISPLLAPHITQLIDANKESLIKAAIADPTSRDKLLEINKAINELKVRDPITVAAWGLACGGVCVVATTSGGEEFR